MKKKVLITGATSGIGLSFAKIFASNNYDLILVGRNKEKLDMIKKDFDSRSDIKTTIYIFSVFIF